MRPSSYAAKAMRVDGQQLQEVLDRVDVHSRQLFVERSVLPNPLQSPYLIVESWWVMLLVYWVAMVPLVSLHWELNWWCKSSKIKDFVLTFSSVIFDHEGLGDGFSDSWRVVAPGNDSGTDPEVSTPYPTRIVSEAEVGDGSSAISQCDVDVSCEQWPLPRPFLHDVVLELGASPVLLIPRREISVQDYHFYLERG